MSVRVADRLLGKVGARMGAAGFFTAQRGDHDHKGDDGRVACGLLRGGER